MLASLARLLVRRRRVVIVGAVVFLALAGAFGGGVASHLKSGGFEDPDSESARAADVLHDTFGASDPNLVLLVTGRDGRSADDPAVAAAGAALTEELRAEEGIDLAVSYWSLGSPPPLKSTKGDQAMVLARIAGDDDEVSDRVEEIAPRYQRSTGVVTVQVGGFAEMFRHISETIERDLARAEAVAIPITLVLLVLVFGSVVAATLPVAIGVMAVIGSFLVLRVVAGITDVSIFALNLTTAMGLGLAIDYSLFIVSRYREELRRGLDVPAAVIRTVQTAGRTVLFSALTVAISLVALLIFPLYFLRSFAYAGVAVVAVAAVGAVVVLPALLMVIGHRIDKWVLWRRRSSRAGTEEGFWHRVAVVVMRRPLPVAAVTTAVLLFLGAPFLGIRLGVPDDRVLAPGNEGRVVTDQLRAGFPSFESTPLSVVAPGTGDPSSRAGDIAAYASSLSSLPSVARVDALTGSYVEGRQVLGATPASTRFASSTGTWFSVVLSVEPVSSEAEDVVDALRADPGPFRDVLVGGQSAELVDSKDSLFSRLPWAALLIALVTFSALFLMFGSLLVPAKAVVLNLLSLTATFGAMVWIFQDGHLSGLLDFTATGSLVATTPILMFCIAFGLSMDYEVFLLSRIKEEYDRSGDNVGSVALGLERTGGIVTAAAALLAIVFLAMTTSQVSFIKLFGLGLAMAVVMDATLIRGALVPAFMRLAGRANWWAPPGLRRVHARWGFDDAEGTAEADAYREKLIDLAERATDEELAALLAEENLTREELTAWGAGSRP